MNRLTSAPDLHADANVPVYTLSIYLAAPGTVVKHPGQPDHRSVAGHAYYSISNGTKTVGYGFSPIETGIRGPGQIVLDEQKFYQNPTYTRTLEISEQQYRTLKGYGEAGRRGNETYFDLNYNGVSNSCIDFVWTGLNRAGLHAQMNLPLPNDPHTLVPLQNFDGTLKVLDNKDMIRSIPAPYPDSPYNSESSRPLPKDRDWKQKLLTDNEVPTTIPRADADQTLADTSLPSSPQRHAPEPRQHFRTGDPDLDRLAAALLADNDRAISQTAALIANSPQMQAVEQWGREQFTSQQQQELQQQELSRQRQTPAMRI